jgi:2,3-bisphosphoglycerate-dependent phosphoglycerate mutase
MLAAMSSVVVLEAHSITEDNEGGFATDCRQGRASATGREFVRDFWRRSRGCGLSVVFTSDLRGAVGTVELAFGSTE